MVKHTQTIRRQESTNCLSVFDHFVGFALNGLRLEGITHNRKGLSYADTPVMKVCDGLNDDEIPDAARLPRKKAVE